MGLKRMLVISFLGASLAACNAGGSGVIGNGNGNQQSQQTEEERLAALEAVCSQIELPGSPLTAVVSNPSNARVIFGETGHFVYDPVDILINEPLLDDQAEVYEFLFDVIHQPNETLLNNKGEIVRQIDNVVTTDGSGTAVTTNLAVMWEGSWRNLSSESVSYYFGTRADDGVFLEIDRGDGWETLIDDDIGTAPKLRCSPADDPVTFAPGEIIQFRFFFRQGAGGSAVSLYRKEAPNGDVIDPVGARCELTSSDAQVQADGFEVIPSDFYYASGGSLPEEWTDECYELGYGVF